MTGLRLDEELARLARLAAASSSSDPEDPIDPVEQALLVRALLEEAPLRPSRHDRLARAVDRARRERLAAGRRVELDEFAAGFHAQDGLLLEDWLRSS